MKNTDLVARLSLDAAPFEKTLRQAQSELQGLARVTNAVPGKSMFSGLATDAAALLPALSSAPVAIAVITAAWSTTAFAARSAGVDFEASLAKISTLGPDAKKSLEATRAAILDTFSSTPVTGSINDLAEANYLLQSSGRTAAEAVKDLQVAAQASVAGYTSATTAVDGLTTVTNAWKDSQISTERASDVLFTAVNLGKSTFEEIARSIGLVAPIAAAAGVRFEEIAAAVAVLSNQGVATSSAFEGIRSALINIQKPTADFQKQYGALAKEFDTSRLIRDGLIKFLKDFSVASGGSSAALGALFTDTTALVAANGLLKNSGIDAENALKRMETAAGATKDALAEANTTTKAQEQLIKNQITRAWTDFGSLLVTVTLPILEEVARVMNDISDNAVFASRDVATFLEKYRTRTPGDQQSQRQETLELKEAQRIITQLQDNPVQFFEGLRTEDLDKLANALQQLRKEGTFGIGAGAITAIREERSRRDAATTQQGFDDFKAGGVRAQLAETVRLEKEKQERLKAARDQATKDALSLEQRKKSTLSDAEQLIRELQKKTAEAVDGTAGALQSALAETLKNGRAQIASGLLPQGVSDNLQGILDRFEALQNQLIAAQQATKATALAIQSATGKDRGASGPSDRLNSTSAADDDGARIARRILDQREKELRALLAGTKALEARKEIEKQLEEIAQARSKKFDNAKPVVSVGETFKQVQALGDLAQQLATVGDQLGLLPRRAVDALRGIGALAEQGAKLKASFGSLSAVAKFGTTVGLVAGVASLASSLFSESPEDKQRKVELRANTDAIRELSRNVGDVSTSSVSGGAFSRARSLLASEFSVRGPISDALRDVSKIDFARYGTSRKEFLAVAESLGITINDTAASFGKLKDALDAMDLQAYTRTFAGSLQRFDDTLRIDGITDPVEIFRRRVAVLTDPVTGFPALADAISGFDLSTVEGRSDAAKRAREIFDDLASGKLTSAQLGGLSVTEGRTALVDFISGVFDLNKGGSTGTGGFNETRSITEVTGSRLASLLGSANGFLSSIAGDVAALRAAFIAPAPIRLVAPSIESLQSSASASGLALGDVNVTVNVTLTRDLVGVGAGGNIAAGNLVGVAISEKVLEAIDRGLNERRLRARLYAGDSRLS